MKFTTQVKNTSILEALNANLPKSETFNWHWPKVFRIQSHPGPKKTPLQSDVDGLNIPHEPLSISKCSVQPCTTKNQRWFLKETKLLVFYFNF